ncbi:MAG: SMC-Scp complex subunit ScpB [Lachnospiraceae bacterium]|nr:SMC-Scp complex subunit ScpB [Lachnospiraceae bacterium]
MEQKKGMIEGILFSMGGSVKKKQLMEVLDLSDTMLSELLAQMKNEYEKENRGIRLIELEDSCQLCTKPEYYDVLIKVVKQPKKYRLTDVMLETLSIIAYKQPVTKQEIEAIRGVKCDHAVNRLIEYNLVCEAGRLNAVGRPILLQTTEEFLRCFGVEHIDDLPMIDPSMLEEFKQEAQEEMNVILEPDEHSEGDH